MTRRRVTGVPSEIPEPLAETALIAARRLAAALDACRPLIEAAREAISAIEIHTFETGTSDDNDILGWICDALLAPVSRFREWDIDDGWWINDACEAANPWRNSPELQEVSK